jgi:hypothetical protein
MASNHEKILWLIEVQTKRGKWKAFAFRTWHKANSWKKKNRLKFNYIGVIQRVEWGPDA